MPLQSDIPHPYYTLRVWRVGCVLSAQRDAKGDDRADCESLVRRDIKKLLCKREQRAETWLDIETLLCKREKKVGT